jgi:hypothetical protein
MNPEKSPLVENLLPSWSLSLSFPLVFSRERNRISVLPSEPAASTTVVAVG